MNRLPHLIQALVHGHLRAIERALAHVHGVRQDFASFANPLRIRTVLNFDAFRLQEAF